MKEPIYWTTKTGVKVNVDDMDENHVRNAFKMLIKVHNETIVKANEIVDKYNTLVKKRKAERGEANFTLNGDMAQFFNDQYFEDEDEFNNCLFNEGY
jgi:hypothetical protein